MPRSLVSFASLAFVVSLAFGGCRCTPSLESVVDAPVTIEAAKKLHAPPDVVVTVERIVNPSSGGGNCGHSPLCIIVLPAILIGEMFPEKHDEVVIIDHGVESYRGSFKTNGDFLQARATKDGIARDFRQLRLQELGRRVVVEVARAPSPGAQPRPIPLAPQAGLLEAYAEAMKRPGHAQCAALINEAIAWLDTEAEPLARTQMSDATWPDECKAGVAESLCSTSTPARLDIVTAAGATTGPLTAKAVIDGCVAKTVWENGGAVPAPGTLDYARALPFTRGYVRGVCTRAIAAGDLRKARAAATGLWDVRAAFAAEPSCQEPGPSAWVRLEWHEPIERAAIEKSFTTPWAADVIALLDVKHHEAILVKALEDDATAAAALKVLNDNRGNRDGTATQLTTGGAALAGLYVRGVPLSFCVDDEQRVAVMEHILALPERERAAARTVFDAAKPDDVVGAARRALGGSEPTKFGSGALYQLGGGSGAACNDDQVAARVLELGHCSAENNVVTCQ